MRDLIWPPADCAYERFCRQGAVPSAYLGCTCWFWTHGGTLADDGIHVGTPPVPWQPQFPADA